MFRTRHIRPIALALIVLMLATACGGGSAVGSSTPAIDLRDPDAAAAALGGADTATRAADEPSTSVAVADDGDDADASSEASPSNDLAAAPGPIELATPTDGASIAATVDAEGIVTIAYPDLDGTVIEWAGAGFQFDDFRVEVPPPATAGTWGTATATLTLDERLGERFDRFDLDRSEVGAIVTADGQRHDRSDIGGFLEADQQGAVEVSWTIFVSGSVAPQELLDGAVIDFGATVAVPVSIAMTGEVDDRAVVNGNWSVAAEVEQPELGFRLDEVQVATALWRSIDNETASYRQAPAGTRVLGLRGEVFRGVEASRFGENVTVDNVVLIVDGEPLTRLNGLIAAPNLILDEDDLVPVPIQYVFEVPADASTLEIDVRSGDAVARFAMNAAVLNDPGAAIDLIAR